MVSIEINFTASRYHATPWDHHVNEGVVEWPPSPWRLLRALLATWHLKARDEVSDSTLSTLLETLAEEAPNYCVPLRSTAAHTRHYMPIGKVAKESGLEVTRKVFDTFVHTSSNEALVVRWSHVTLPEDARGALAVLLNRLGYLGRAESWVEARLLEADEADRTREPNVVPLNGDGEVGEGRELFRLLCPRPSADIAAWRSLAFEQECERRLAEKKRRAKEKGKNPEKEKLTKADKDKIDATLPKNLLDALQVQTGDLQKQGWSGVPGTQWVDYVRPRDLLASTAVALPQRKSTNLPTVARFAVASQVPPRLTEALSFSEKVRQSLLSRTDAHPVFLGKNAAGQHLTGHRHAFIFPEANREHGRISHVTLYARLGFDEAARRALETLRKVWGHEGHDVQLLLLGVGQPKDFAGTNREAGQCPLLVETAIWESRTPFVPTRHLKTNGRGEPRLDEKGLPIGSPEHDLRRLLHEQGFPSPSAVEPLKSTSLDGKSTRWLQFRTLRKLGNGSRGANRGFGFRIRFNEPVRGPLALGYGAHFGLGVFVPGAQDASG